MASASSACLTSWVKSSFFPHPSMERCNFHEWYSVPIFEMECLYDILWLCLPWHVRPFRELGEAHGSTWKHMEAREASETEKRMSSVITFPDQTSALIACSISSVSLVTSFFDTIWFGRGRVLSGVLSDLSCPYHVLIFQQHQHWIRRICRPNMMSLATKNEDAASLTESIALLKSTASNSFVTENFGHFSTKSLRFTSQSSQCNTPSSVDLVHLCRCSARETSSNWVAGSIPNTCQRVTHTNFSQIPIPIIAPTK